MRPLPPTAIRLGLVCAAALPLLAGPAVAAPAAGAATAATETAPAPPASPGDAELERRIDAAVAAALAEREAAAPTTGASRKDVAAGSEWIDFFALLKARYTVQKNTGFAQEDQNGFRLVDTRIGARGSDLALVGPGRYWYEFEAELASGTLELQDGMGGWRPHEAFGITVGQFKVPFGWAVLNSTPRLMFADRSLAAALAVGRDRGIMLDGTIEAGELVADRPFRLSYQAGAFNGIGLGLQRNFNERYLYAGRVLVEPMGAIGSDESDLDPCSGLMARDTSDCDAGRPLRLAVGGSVAVDQAIAQGEAFEAGREEIRWAVEGHLKVAGLAVHGEYLAGTVEASPADPEFGRSGYYVQAGYAMPFAPWLEVAGRTEYVDVNDERGDLGLAAGGQRDQVPFSARRIHTAGLNAYLAQHHAKLQINYVLTDLTEGVTESAGGDPLFGDKVILQAQIYF